MITPDTEIHTPEAMQIIATVTTPAPLRMFNSIVGAIAKEYPKARMLQSGDIIQFVILNQDSLLPPDP